MVPFLSKLGVWTLVFDLKPIFHLFSSFYSEKDSFLKFQGKTVKTLSKFIKNSCFSNAPKLNLNFPQTKAQNVHIFVV